MDEREADVSRLAMVLIYGTVVHHMGEWSTKMRHGRVVTVAFGIMIAGAGVGFAQEPTGTTAAKQVEEAGQAKFENTPKWELSAEPGLWYVAPSGKASFPASSGVRGPKIFLNDLNMDSPRLSPSAEINLRRGDWGVSVRGFMFSSSDQNWTAPYASRIGTLDFVPGDRFQTSLDFGTLEIEGSYRFLDSGRLPENAGKDWKFRATLDGVFGARLYDIDFRVDRVSGTAATVRESITLVEALGGVKGSIEISDEWTVDLLTTFGGLNESFSWDIMPGFQWRPFRNFGVQIGYRQLLFRIDKGDDGMKWDGAMAGLSFGIVVRF